MPERIQLRRTKGWRKPPDAVVVARPSKWGNPFPVGETVHQKWTGIGEPGTFEEIIVADNAHAVRLFRRWLTTRWWGAQKMRGGIGELTGHDLACWCPLNVPCHAEVLLELANEDDHPLLSDPESYAIAIRLWEDADPYTRRVLRDLVAHEARHA